MAINLKLGNPGYDGSEVTLSEALPNHALVLTLLTCDSGRVVGQPYFTGLGESCPSTGSFRVEDESDGTEDGG